MSTAVMNTADITLTRDGRPVRATLTWWHHGWLEYALRLDGPTGVVEAVEDSWFAAITEIARDLAAAGYELPEPPQEGPATNPDEHRARWVSWLGEGFPKPR
ncbi:hypothetical protein [Actinokineospora sp. UTMC 2448]|uniref:hypothetical protein n=1 Tax=Actinokineospora sp. UTMC 2448 TaxID=2268449 RepID=UPI0021641ECE|nr:hypothetical protein [Actinokineospora sp. UTMC 2448]